MILTQGKKHRNYGPAPWLIEQSSLRIEGLASSEHDDFFRELIQDKSYNYLGGRDGKGNVWYYIGPYYAKRVTPSDYVQVLSIKLLKSLLFEVLGDLMVLAKKIDTSSFDVYESDIWMFYNMEQQLGDWKGVKGVSSLSAIEKIVIDHLSEEFECSDCKVFFLNKSLSKEWKEGYLQWPYFAYYEFLSVNSSKAKIRRYTFSIII